MNNIINKIALTTLLLIGSASTVFASDYDQQFSVSSGGKLDITTASGSIKVLTHDASIAIVTAKVDGRDADDFVITSDVSNNTLKVRGEVEGNKWSRQLKVEFTITVPENFDLEIDTSGGSIQISELTGDVNAHTSGGSIRVGTIKGDVKLDTSGGSISTEDIYGVLNARTSGGSIKTSFAEQLKDDAVLSTSGGSITAYLVEDVQIDLDASTSGGRVRTDFEVNGRIKKRSIRGEINGGGPKLTLRTSGGSVKVLSR